MCSVFLALLLIGLSWDGFVDWVWGGGAGGGTNEGRFFDSQKMNVLVNF